MSFLSITEYQHAERGPEGTLQVPLEINTVTRQRRELSATAAGSAPFQSTTRFVRLCADVACYYAFGVDPIPSLSPTNGSYLPAGVVDWVAVPVGQSYKVAARTA